MSIIDISWPISASMTAYKDRKVVTLQPTKEFHHDHVRELLLTLGSHTGTHVDAPAHFIREGITLENIPLDNLIGRCQVIDMVNKGTVISASHCRDLNIQPGDIVLFKTRNSKEDATASFNPEFTYIDSSTAEYLVAKKIRTIGVDYLGIERNQPAHETHLTFMQAGIVIIEGLRLWHVEPGHYFLVCLPLLVIGADGAPARAILIKE